DPLGRGDPGGDSLAEMYGQFGFRLLLGPGDAHGHGARISLWHRDAKPQCMHDISHAGRDGGRGTGYADRQLTASTCSRGGHRLYTVTVQSPCQAHKQVPLSACPARRRSRRQEAPRHCPARSTPTHARRQEVAVEIGIDLMMGWPFKPLAWQITA